MRKTAWVRLGGMSSDGRYVYRVRSSEVGPDGRLGLASLCHLLQESASLDAHERMASPALLLERGLTWFLSRLHLVVKRYPGWREAVAVETWPAEHARPFAMREYRVFDGEGAEAAVATSAWLLVDAERRKPLRRMPEDLGRFHFPEAPWVLPRERQRLPALEEVEHEESFRVRCSDLDLNGHMNHVAYVAQLAQAVPEQLWRELQVAELRLDLKAECHFGDEILARAGRLGGDGRVLHSLVRRRDEKEVVRATTRWVPPRSGC